MRLSIKEMKSKMRRYPKCNKLPKNFRFTKFHIIVPTERDRKEMMQAFHYLHNCDIDTDFVTVNQLVHQYEHDDESDRNSAIMVNPELFCKVENIKLAKTMCQPILRKMFY